MLYLIKPIVWKKETALFEIHLEISHFNNNYAKHSLFWIETKILKHYETFRVIFEHYHIV